MMTWRAPDLVTAVSAIGAIASPFAGWIALLTCRKRAQSRNLTFEDVVTIHNVVGVKVAIAIPTMLFLAALVFIILPNIRSTGIRGLLWEVTFGLMISAVSVLFGLLVAIPVSMISGVCAWWISVHRPISHPQCQVTPPR